MPYPLDEMPRPIELEDAPSTFSVLCIEGSDTERYLLADSGDTDPTKAVVVHVRHTKQGASHSVGAYAAMFGNARWKQHGQLTLNAFAPWRKVHLFGMPDQDIYFPPGHMDAGSTYDGVYGNSIWGTALPDPWDNDSYTGGELQVGAGVSEDEEGEDGAELFSQFYTDKLMPWEMAPSIIAPEPRTHRLTTDQISVSVRKLFFRYGVEACDWGFGQFLAYACFLYRWYDSGTSTWGNWEFTPLHSNVPAQTGRYRHWVGVQIAGSIQEGTTDAQWFELPVSSRITRPSSSKTKVRWKMGFVKPIEDAPYLEIDTSGPMTDELEYVF